MDRQISWHISKDGERLAGIEDTGRGWAVVDGDGERLKELEGYDAKERREIERYYEEYIWQRKNTTSSSERSN